MQQQSATPEVSEPPRPKVGGVVLQHQTLGNQQPQSHGLRLGFQLTRQY